MGVHNVHCIYIVCTLMYTWYQCVMYIVYKLYIHCMYAVYTGCTMYMTQFTRIIIRRADKLSRDKDTINSVYFAMTLPKYLEAAKFTFFDGN